MSKLSKRTIGGGYRPLSVKGFTLIELLAVIVILAVIAIIVTPMIMGTIESSRENSYKTSAQNYANAVDNAIAASMVKGVDTPNGTFSIETLKTKYTIDANGKLPTVGTVTISGNKVVSYDLYIEGYKIDKYAKNDTVYVVKSSNTTAPYQEALLNGADPVLDYGMIPVNIADNGAVTKADITTAWYSYTNKKWANVVLVTSGTRDKYQKANAGTTITSGDILAYLVWIPKYGYKINAVQAPITITFGYNAGTDTTSVHPGFTFGTTELNGIWVGKFELTGDTTTPTVLPNVQSLRSLNVSSFFTTIQKFDSDTYGLSSDSHMAMNKEWGAIAYLTNSIYGRCTGTICTEVRRNNASDYYTGYSEVNVATTGWSATSVSTNQFDVHTNTSITQAYNTATGYLASTTGNISGIYDMSGGAWEYVMGTYNSTISSSGFSSLPDSKYYQTYTTLANSANGDALKEVAGWYNDYANFVSAVYPWFIRGGRYNDGANAGVFYFNYTNGGANGDVSARVVVSPGA